MKKGRMAVLIGLVAGWVSAGVGVFPFDGKVHFRTEGGDFARYLVVSQAADRVVIDARAAFDAGMKKLVMTSDGFDRTTIDALRGKECTLLSDFGGTRGSTVHCYFEGQQKIDGQSGRKHYYRFSEDQTKGHRKTYGLIAEVPEAVESLHLRWDIVKAAGPVEFYGATYAPLAELPFETSVPVVEPELLFHATFDGSATAAFAKGAAEPLRAENVAFVEDGRRGGAVRLTRAAKSALAYAAAGNLDPVRGTVSLWFKKEWNDNGRQEDGREIWRALFSNEPVAGDARVGSGQLWFWFYGGKLRADQSDDDDSYRTWSGKEPERGWNHLAVTWNEKGVRLYLNGKAAGALNDGLSPMVAALSQKGLLTFNRRVFERFFVGGQGDAMQFDGLIDDLKIYSAPLTADAVRALWREGQDFELHAEGIYALADTEAVVRVRATGSRVENSKLKYCVRNETGEVVSRWKEKVSGKTASLLVNLPAGAYTVSATDGTAFFGSAPLTVFPKENPYTRAAAGKTPGRIDADDLELAAVFSPDDLLTTNNFRKVGAMAVKRLDGRPYFEAGTKAGERFALRFHLPVTNAPLWLFEIDYPDDAVRTADLIVQRSRKPESDYTLQVGYACGDEYTNTGTMLTHRCLYWASDPDVTLIAMTARDGAPAAVAGVRVWRVKSAALPAADVREPEDPPAPGGAARFWRDVRAGELSRPEEAVKIPRRTVALYFEDPAIGSDFATPVSNGFLPEELNTVIDRTAALMKFTGENVLAYPGAWYHGLIGERYNPRHHAPDFLSAWYAKFDREGLGFYPTMNINNMPVAEGLVTRQTMGDGSLHDSPVAIHDTGKPNWGGWHNTPPNFNFHDKEVRKYLSRVMAALAEQGARHPSFKGICVHLTRHSLTWFGDPASGYNEGTVKAFAKAKGLKVPKEHAGEALRGKHYAAWLRATAWEDWLQWRCDQVTEFYAAEARKLREKRPDLKLWLNYMMPADIRHPDFTKEDFLETSWRGAGLDAARLTKEIPNLILGHTLVPADYRWRGRKAFGSDAAYARQRTLDETAGFYAPLKGAAYPLTHQHDRYWESPIGRLAGKGNTLSCDWLQECTWRVSTINPSGLHARRHFVEGLRFGDVLGWSKGGFLIGTYGMEEALVPVIQAFRALPAVVFDDVTAEGNVRVRAKTCYGKRWIYAVNTGAEPASVTLELPKRARDLVTGERLGGLFGPATVTLTLGPYELRSFAAEAAE